MSLRLATHVGTWQKEKWNLFNSWKTLAKGKLLKLFTKHDSMCVKGCSGDRGLSEDTTHGSVAVEDTRDSSRFQREQWESNMVVESIPCCQAAGRVNDSFRRRIYLRKSRPIIWQTFQKQLAVRYPGLVHEKENRKRIRKLSSLVCCSFCVVPSSLQGSLPVQLKNKFVCCCFRRAVWLSFSLIKRQQFKQIPQTCFLQPFRPNSLTFHLQTVITVIVHFWF